MAQIIVSGYHKEKVTESITFNVQVKFAGVLNEKEKAHYLISIRDKLENIVHEGFYLNIVESYNSFENDLFKIDMP